MNKRIRNKKMRDALIRAAIRMLREGFYTLAQAKREVSYALGATHRRRLRAAIRAMTEFPAVPGLDIIRSEVYDLLRQMHARKANPGVNEHERL